MWHDPPTAPGWESIKRTFMELKDFYKLQVKDSVRILVSPKRTMPEGKAQAEPFNDTVWIVEKIETGIDPKFSESVWNTKTGRAIYFKCLSNESLGSFRLRTEFVFENEYELSHPFRGVKTASCYGDWIVMERLTRGYEHDKPDTGNLKLASLDGSSRKVSIAVNLPKIRD